MSDFSKGYNGSPSAVICHEQFKKGGGNCAGLSPVVVGVDGQSEPPLNNWSSHPTPTGRSDEEGTEDKVLINQNQEQLSTVIKRMVTIKEEDANGKIFKTTTFWEKDDGEQAQPDRNQLRLHLSGALRIIQPERRLEGVNGRMRRPTQPDPVALERLADQFLDSRSGGAMFSLG